MILIGRLSERRQPFSMRTPLFWAGPKIQGPAAQSTATITIMGAATTTTTTPTSSTIRGSSKGSQSVCLRLRRRVGGGGGWSCIILDMAKFRCYDHTPQHLHGDALPYTLPKGTLIVNCLIMLPNIREAEDGSHFLFVPSSSSGFRDPWVERSVSFKRGTAFFLMPLMFIGGRAFQRPPVVVCPILASWLFLQLT